MANWQALPLPGFDRADLRAVPDDDGGEVVRLCPNCKQPITRADEQRGRCPHCGQMLVTLAGDDDVVFVAYRDHGSAGMVPVNEGGRLVVFADLDAARAAAGMLGVGAPTHRWRLADIGRQHGLTVQGGKP